MNKLVAMNNTCICEKVDIHAEKEEDGIIVNRPVMKLYKILNLSSDNKDFMFKPGDIVMSTSVGDEIEYDGTIYYIFETKHLMAKIEEYYD